MLSLLEYERDNSMFYFRYELLKYIDEIAWLKYSFNNEKLSLN